MVDAVDLWRPHRTLLSTKEPFLRRGDYIGLPPTRTRTHDPKLHRRRTPRAWPAPQEGDQPRRTLVREADGAPVQSQRIFQATGTTEGDRQLRFLIYQRQSLRDEPSYSCGIVYLPPGGPRLTLARYNGPNHQHADIRYKPHIHRATEAAILAGRKPEYAADETTRYETIEGALACLIEDFGLSGIRAKPDEPSLFNGHQS